jgi:hypothetical protein
MARENAAHVYKEVKRAHSAQERQRALSDPKTFVELAVARGHRLTVEGLEAQLNQLSDEDVAAIFNPGLPPRLHLFPR